MLTSLQVKYFNNVSIFVTMDSSRINQDCYGLVVDLTFHFDHGELILCLVDV